MTLNLQILVVESPKPRQHLLQTEHSVGDVSGSPRTTHWEECKLLHYCCCCFGLALCQVLLLLLLLLRLVAAAAAAVAPVAPPTIPDPNLLSLQHLPKIPALSPELMSQYRLLQKQCSEMRTRLLPHLLLLTQFRIRGEALVDGGDQKKGVNLAHLQVSHQTSRWFCKEGKWSERGTTCRCSLDENSGCILGAIFLSLSPRILPDKLHTPAARCSSSPLLCTQK